MKDTKAKVEKRTGWFAVFGFISLNYPGHTGFRGNALAIYAVSYFTGRGNSSRLSAMRVERSSGFNTLIEG